MRCRVYFNAYVVTPAQMEEILKTAAKTAQVNLPESAHWVWFSSDRAISVDVGAFETARAFKSAVEVLHGVAKVEGPY